MSLWLHAYLLRMGVIAATGVGVYEIARGLVAL